MHCTKCGKKNEDDAIFCKGCGINMETGAAPDTQVPEGPTEKEAGPETVGPRRAPRDRGSGKGMKMFIIVVGVLIIAFSLYYVLRYEDVDEHEILTYDPGTTPETLTIDLETDGGEIEIVFTSDMDAPVVHIDHNKIWRGTVTSEPSFKVSFFGGSVMGDMESEITVTLRSDVKYNIDTSTSNGAFSLNSDIVGISFGTISTDTRNGASNINIHNATASGKIKTEVRNGASNLLLTDCNVINVESTSKSGSSNAIFTNCTIGDIETSSDSGSSNALFTNCIVGDIEIDADAGSSNIVLEFCKIGNIMANADGGFISINTRDITVDDDVTWTCTVDSGGAGLDIVQSIPMGADVTVDVDVDNKDLDVKFKGNSTFVRAKFSCDAAKDLSLSNGPGFKDPVGGMMESVNYNDTALDQFQFTLETSKRNIEVEAENP